MATWLACFLFLFFLTRSHYIDQAVCPQTHRGQPASTSPDLGIKRWLSPFNEDAVLISVSA